MQQNVVRYDGVEGSAIIDASPGNLNGEVASPFRLQSSLENVQEFRVDSNNYPAEFGTGTGGQVSVVTKSGSNSFHGSAFEYLRNDALDAANFFDNVAGQKSPLKLNQFGGSLGGPIKKDRLFFFGSYEGYRLPAGFTAVVSAPGGGASRNVRRPDIIAGVSPYLNNDRSLLNPAAFAAPAPGTFGNLPRKALRGPSFRQADLIFSKRIPLSERVRMEFRTEVFNVFNRTNFANPSARTARFSSRCGSTSNDPASPRRA